MKYTLGIDKQTGLTLRETNSQPQLCYNTNIDQENVVECSNVASDLQLEPTKDSQSIMRPSQFNPRESKNMPLSEKISSWLLNIPWFQREDGVWVSECYSGRASSRGLSDDLRSTPDDQDIFEQQARQITRFITSSYLFNGENTARPLSRSSKSSLKSSSVWQNSHHRYPCYDHTELEGESDFD